MASAAPAPPIHPLMRRHAGFLIFAALMAAMLVALAFITAARTPATAMETEAQAVSLVHLTLVLDRIRKGEVDSYFGPPALAHPAPDDPRDLEGLGVALDALARDLSARGVGLDEARRVRLRARTAHLRLIVETLAAPGSLDFATEAKRLYGIDVAATAEDEDRWRRARSALESLLPGNGPLGDRTEAFRRRFIVPVDRRERLFMRALAECRARTLERWPLPTGERLDIQWTEAVPAAWHRYQDGLRSTLSINRNAIALPGQAIDLACHEGYPGHHAQFVAAEAAGAPAGLAIEDRVVALRSPETVVREGAADAGVDIAFPEGERHAFLRDVLFPMAGLDPAEAERYARFEALIHDLAGAALPILQRYRDGDIGRFPAAKALGETALVSSPEALLDFTDHHGAYVVGYTIARDRIAATLGRDCGTGWQVLQAIAVHPQLALSSTRPAPPAGATPSS